MTDNASEENRRLLQDLTNEELRRSGVSDHGVRVETTGENAMTMHIEEGFTPEQLSDPATIARILEATSDNPVPPHFASRRTMFGPTADEWEQHGHLGRRTWPRWPGAPAFGRVTEILDRLSVMEWVTDDKLSPLGTLSLRAGMELRAARPIAVATEQVRALPLWDTDEDGWQFGRDLRLPFDNIYLDISGTDGGGLVIGVTRPGDADVIFKTGIVGYVIHQDDEALEIMPFGMTMAEREFGGLKPGDTVWTLYGAAIIRRNGGVFTPTREDVGAQQHSVATAVYGAGVFNQAHDLPTGEHPPSMQDSCAVVIPGTDKIMLESALAADDDNDGTEILGMHERATGFVIAAAALRALNVLYFMESANVELVDAPVSRQQRRQAQRTGTPIAQTVRVRRRIRRGGAAQPATEGAGYSHQFEVEGHYNHVTRGSHVACGKCRGKQGYNTLDKPSGSIVWETCARCGGTGLDPEKVKPCVRRDSKTGALTCPDGCRREWMPPHWKGPEGGVAVPKLRKVA